MEKRTKCWRHKVLAGLLLMAGIGVCILPMLSSQIVESRYLWNYLVRIEKMKEGIALGQITEGPLLLYPAAVLRSWGFGIEASFKVVQLLYIILSYGNTYMFLKKVTRREIAASLLTLLLLLNPFYGRALYLEGSLSLLLAYIYLPLLFLGLYKKRLGEKKAGWLIGVSFWILILSVFGYGAIGKNDGFRVLLTILGGGTGLIAVTVTGCLARNFLQRELRWREFYRRFTALLLLFVIAEGYYGVFGHFGNLIDVSDQLLAECRASMETLGGLSEWTLGVAERAHMFYVGAGRNLLIAFGFCLFLFFYYDLRKDFWEQRPFHTKELYGLSVLGLLISLTALLLNLKDISNLLLMFSFFLCFSGGIGGVLRKECYPENVTEQMALLSLLLAVFWDLQLGSPYADFAQKKCAISGAAALTANGLIWSARYIKGLSVKKVTKYWKRNWPMWLIIGLFLLFSVETIDDYYKWDSHYYVLQLAENRAFDFTFSSLLQLNLVNHLCSGFSLFAMLFTGLIGNAWIACRVANLFLGAVTIYCYGMLIKSLLGNQSRYVAWTAAAIFAFSPWLMGIVGEISLDYASLCFFVWLTYVSYRKKHILMLFGSFLLCFSKEPGAVLCVGYAVGLFLINVRSEKKEQNGIVRVWKAMWHENVIAVSFPVCVWLVEYKLTSHWGTGDSFHYFGIQQRFIAKKAITMLALNFNWLFILFILAGLLAVVFRKDIWRLWRSPVCDIFLPVSGAWVAFISFSLLFVTYNHPRYILPYEFPLTLFGTLAAIYCLKQVMWKKTAVTALAALGLVQSFYTLDPLSSGIFDRLSTGNSYIITTNWVEKCHNFGDSTVYNRQYTYLETAVNRALAAIAYDETKVILLSSPFGKTDGYTPESIYYSLFGGLTAYWDPVNEKRVTTNSGDLDVIQWGLVRTATEEELQGKEIYYFSLPWVEPEEGLAQFEKEENISVKYRGWRIDIWRLKWSSK